MKSKDIIFRTGHWSTLMTQRGRALPEQKETFGSKTPHPFESQPLIFCFAWFPLPKLGVLDNGFFTQTGILLNTQYNDEK